MSSEEVLRESERSALEKTSGKEYVVHVDGKVKKQKVKGKGKIKSFGAVGFITLMLGIIAIVFSSGNLIPSAISERLIEETDVQYADAVESKKLVFQQALYSGSIPDNTAEVLKNKGVLVGYETEEGFKETNEADRELSLKMNDEVISAGEFVDKVSDDAKLYSAFTDATYGRAAYYYDESAERVFDELGTSRNNYTSESDFNEVMREMVGEGSEITVSSVGLTEKERVLEDGRKEKYEEYILGGSANSDEAGSFIESVRLQNRASNATDAALNSADALKVADTMTKEEKSSLFFLTFMENISKMKAGDGAESKINEAMNYLYEKAETEVVDVKTGEVKKVTGSALESPSLYAVLTGEKVSTESTESYSSDRILKTVENKVSKLATSETISGTIGSSKGSKFKSAIGRFIANGVETASEAVLDAVTPTVSSSLINNSYDTIKGIRAGEMIVEGAVNVGKKLAKSSGSTAGDLNATLSYFKLTNEVLAMDRKVDKMNRSPFDITSRNTFLGSVVYKLAILSVKSRSSLIFGKISNLFGTAIKSLSPVVFADDEEGYLTTFGDCPTLGSVGAVGSAICSEISTFDTTTLNDTFNNVNFIKFVEANTELDYSGTRKIKQGSDLAKFVLYNNERTVPVGVMDGGILDSVRSNSSSNSFISDILKMVKNLVGASESEKRAASGATFINSGSNPDWETYKYAQRYVSLARATSALRQYAKDETSYQNIPFFEGQENPVIAFLEEYSTLANR